MRTFYLFLALVPLALAVLVGCYRSGEGPALGEAPAPQTAPAADTEHGHKDGAHGGRIVPIGRDNYHAEVIFEKDSLVRLYTLGQDEARELEVPRQVLEAYARPTDGTEATAFELRSEPQKEDAPDRTSRFSGTLPEKVRGKAVELSVRIAIGGERFRFAARSPEPEHTGMPDKMADAAERDLYLTPGGMYTQADIAANGHRTASEAFQGLKPQHDTHPKPGDHLCPISETKASPKFSWIIGGQRYEFCCPPCVDEFLKQAKERPETIKPASAYVKGA